uniref:EF-hand domain-containing protein n=1 Tax=Macrostomum lignano TaxID=282301 RepID=A0A1I8FH09_9PLAT
MQASSKPTNLAQTYRATHQTRAPPAEEKSDIADNPFLNAFIAIDEDGSETITVDELRAYMKKNNFQESFVKKWLTMFDLDGDGVISFDEFCEVLGLQTKSARNYRRQSLIRSGLPSDVRIILVHMSEWTQSCKSSATPARTSTTRRDIALNVKQRLDREFGPMWHIMIVQGKYYASYSHEPEMCIFFKFDSRVFLIWKTPEEGPRKQ